MFNLARSVLNVTRLVSHHQQHRIVVANRRTIATSLIRFNQNNTENPDSSSALTAINNSNNEENQHDCSAGNQEGFDDLPDPTMENPFLKEKRQCILCRYQVQVDYKNVRLLSQFVSPHTGRLYDKHITGLCERQHRRVLSELSRAIRVGLISPYYRDPHFNDDPKLFDPSRPQRANPY